MAMKNEITQHPTEVVTNCDHITPQHVQSCILSVRGQQVVIDRDLAAFYGVETKVLNQAVKRNINRFPERYRFQLTKEELQEVVTNCDHLLSLKFSPTPHYVFTEEGVAQLSSMLRSDKAVEVSIMIMDAFVAMRRFLSANAGMFQRIELLEKRQLATDQKIEDVLDCLEQGTLREKAHIFSAGQIYDAKAFITELIARATTRVILVDGYINATTINLLEARAEGIPATIYTGSIGSSIHTLVEQFNTQYPTKPLVIHKWQTAQHDRWLIIDSELWHCGASIKDAGLRTFGIDPIGLSADVVLSQV